MNILKKDIFKKIDGINIPSTLLDIINYVKDLEIYKNKIIGKASTNNIYLSNLKNNKNIPDIYNLNISTDLLKPNEYDNNLLEPNEYDSKMTCNSQYTYIIDDWWNETKNNNNVKKTLCVLYNPEYECNLICNYSKTIKNISDEFGDFIIIREYNDINDKYNLILEELITENMYCNKILIEQKLDSFESLYDIKKINENEKEKSIIIFYIKQNYIISDNINKRIKVSILMEEVEKELKINNPNLRYNFANYLNDIGLQKKRYSDGMYLYGIETKANAKINDKNNKITNKEVEELVKLRKIEIEQIYTSKLEKNSICNICNSYGGLS